MINVWIAFSDSALTQFKLRRSNPSVYSGPMDDTTYRIMSKMSDMDNVQRLFKVTPPINGKTYTLFSLYVDAPAKAQEAIDHLTTEWPTHFIVLGAWWTRSGLQVGTRYDGEMNILGTPVYPVHPQTWRLMPDLVTYDQDGNETSRTPAASNSDLRQINLIAGQANRIFS